MQSELKGELADTSTTHVLNSNASGSDGLAYSRPTHLTLDILDTDIVFVVDKALLLPKIHQRLRSLVSAKALWSHFGCC